MALYFLKMFGVSLVLTVLLELAVLIALREYSKKNAVLLILVNVLTNPAAVLAAWLMGQYFPEIPALAVQIPLEVIVVWTEGYLYHSFTEASGYDIRHPFRLAAAANAVSWGIGVCLQNL